MHTMNAPYTIRFPASDATLTQDRAYFHLGSSNGHSRRIRFHDYHELYARPGLYEQLFYERLKCQSPQKIAAILEQAVAQSSQHFSELRVLDLGAGNGMMGEALKKYGVSRLIGVDILPEAARAVERDRPGLYDAFFVRDFTALSAAARDEVASWSPNCLTTVAALGFGDIPVPAFVEAFNLIQGGGWVAFNIKESFVDPSDTTGFSRLVRELMFSNCLQLYHLERYRHRFSIDGAPLYYFAVAGRKIRDIEPDVVPALEVA